MPTGLSTPALHCTMLCDVHFTQHSMPQGQATRTCRSAQQMCMKHDVHTLWSCSSQLTDFVSRKMPLLSDAACAAATGP